MTCYCEKVGKQYFYRIILELPDEVILKEEVIEHAVSFMMDSLYHPNVIKESFDQEQFELERESLQLQIKNHEKNIYGYSNNQIINLIDTGGDLKENIQNNQDQLNSVTAKEVYNFYKKSIKNKEPYVFVFGNVDEDKIEVIMDKNIYQNGFTRESITNQLTCYLKKAM